ncbi:transposase [Methermicoccus shengliensis]|uniref:Transposase zinc-ribbon domain-containing protein n=1 Tax=Methermicoccus shengliensis TaxID=660064 RepID=A0A832VXP6_9EURY|nr:transposase [Methermicoccus shengliensis]KUK05000.1 MAG: hypothetical protein XD46_0346 [Euryarchaeota archaeon 55_53]KUK30045.1 MAG: hypothetical protein XD62_0886 [Methanosarcinales archeaon 56_1174]MDI3488227.1 hypothetical protein [Methanosarcinales archaeon]MDN5295025.1 hypothetical protein [Methanosarcinales archaeon]HIH70037.1 hypothetical protein [Methermicoccus shengliensis]
MRKLGCRLRCPVCGSTEIYEIAGGYMGNVYRCKHCGYVGAFVVEANEKLAREIERQYLESKDDGDEDSEAKDDNQPRR